jgi:hypothetical protein
MAVVTEYLVQMISKQVEEKGLVVWYDPEKAYGTAAAELSLPKTTVARYDGSFLKLRHEIDHLLNDDERPPRLVVYVPIERTETASALIELDCAGVVMQPRQQPPACNTRLKEQLKKMGSFEFHQTSFSLIDNETREEKFIGVPEQGGRDMISLDPLAPGSVYTSSVDDHAKVGLYRLEVGCSPGTGKLKIAGGVEGLMRESINRAFAYLMGQKVKMGVGQQVDTTDFHVEAIDLLSNHVACEAGIALVVAIYSALKRLPVQAGLVILGDLSIQGNIKPMRSLAEPLQVAMDNGARKALIPLENKRNFLEVSGEIVERVDPVFFSDPMTAAMKALSMT